MIYLIWLQGSKKKSLSVSNILVWIHQSQTLTENLLLLCLESH